MKRRLIMIVAGLALTVGVSSVTALASEMQVLKQGNGYVVIGGQGMDSLQQTLEEIGAYIGEMGEVICPETPEMPEAPEAPEEPEMPDVPEEPEMPEAPQMPETPESPETETPDDNISESEVHPYVTQILNLVNEERAKAGLSALTLDMNITAAATVRAKEIKQSFSHTRPNGSSFSTALTEQGVTYRGSGENIAWGQKSPEQVMNGWMNSDGHRANILNKNYKNLGVGYYQDENGVNYWVQLFTY